MAGEKRSQKLVETHKAVSAGIASVVTAVFTSKLGVAGTLIGTGLTAMLVTLTSAILKAQLEKASQTVSGLPGAVQGSLPIQQIRIPGRPNPEPDKKPVTPEKRLPNLRSRLRAIPRFLRDLPPSQRRKVLIAGTLAGLVATVIGLGGVTGIELAGGKTLSCQVWSSCGSENNTSTGSSGGTGPSISILGGNNNGSNDNVSPSSPSPGEQPATPGNNGTPKGPGPEQQPNAAPQQPNAAPKQGGEEQAPPPQ
jgi:hypothetical protein